MQVWCDSRNTTKPQHLANVFDKSLTNDANQSLYIEGNLIFENGKNIGIFAKITNIIKSAKEMLQIIESSNS